MDERTLLVEQRYLAGKAKLTVSHDNQIRIKLCTSLTDEIRDEVERVLTAAGFIALSQERSHTFRATIGAKLIKEVRFGELRGMTLLSKPRKMLKPVTTSLRIDKPRCGW